MENLRNLHEVRVTTAEAVHQQNISRLIHDHQVELASSNKKAKDFQDIILKVNSLSMQHAGNLKISEKKVKELQNCIRKYTGKECIWLVDNDKLEQQLEAANQKEEALEENLDTQAKEIAELKGNAKKLSRLVDIVSQHRDSQAEKLKQVGDDLEKAESDLAKSSVDLKKTRDKVRAWEDFWKSRRLDTQD